MRWEVVSLLSLFPISQLSFRLSCLVLDKSITELFSLLPQWLHFSPPPLHLVHLSSSHTLTLSLFLPAVLSSPHRHPSIDLTDSHFNYNNGRYQLLCHLEVFVSVQRSCVSSCPSSTHTHTHTLPVFELGRTKSVSIRMLLFQ